MPINVIYATSEVTKACSRNLYLSFYSVSMIFALIVNDLFVASEANTKRCMRSTNEKDKMLCYLTR